MVRTLEFTVRLVPKVIPGHRSGTVESKLRQLVMKLEYVETLTIVHPFIKGIDKVVVCQTDEEVRAVAEGELPRSESNGKKEDCVGNEGTTLHTTTFYIGLAVEPKQGKLSILRVLCTSLILSFV